jgi:hypothetical protein
MTHAAHRRLFGAAFLAGALILAPGIACAGSEKDQTSAKRGPRVRLGGVMVGVGYTHSTGYPAHWPYPYWSRWAYPWYSPFYDPWWGGGFFHPGYFTGFRQGPGMGEVKIRGEVRDAEVYLDGAFAGTADKLKSMWLEAGAYDLELRAPDETYKKRIYVLTGKRLDLRPVFRPQPDKEFQ